jgi:hypothetical protein
MDLYETLSPNRGRLMYGTGRLMYGVERRIYGAGHFYALPSVSYTVPYIS